jgi:hypothetical protein
MNLFDAETKFQIVFNDNPVQIQTMDVGKNTMYLARFADQPPVMVTRASDANGVRFWTSVPEGRQKLAEVIGELISDHIRKTL